MVICILLLVDKSARNIFLYAVMDDYQTYFNECLIILKSKANLFWITLVNNTLTILIDVGLILKQDASSSTVLNSNTHLYPVECRGINILTRRPVPTNKRKRDTYEFEGTRCIERIILRNRYDTLRLLEWILKTLRRILESFYEILRKNVEDFVLVLLDNLLIKDVIEIVLEQDDHDVISHLTMIVRCIMLNERFSTNISRSLRKDFNKASATYIDVLKDSRMYNC
jgi:hypothetical protein